MLMSKADLVELFEQLGVPEARKWSPAKLRGRANRLNVLDEDVLPKLTQDARATLFTAWAAIDAYEEGWADPITVTPKAIEAFPYCRLSDRYGSRLFDWMKKKGFRDRKARWEKMSDSEKRDAVEEGVERLVMFFLKDGEV